MAVKSQIRKIALNSSVDLSSHQLEIKDYDGFASCNSLYLNKRLKMWKRLPRGSNEIILGSYYYKVNEEDSNLFDIQKKVDSTLTTVMSIDRHYVKTKLLDEFPSNMLEIDNPFPEAKWTMINPKDNDIAGALAYNYIDDLSLLITGEIQYGSSSEYYSFAREIGHKEIYIFKDCEPFEEDPYITLESDFTGLIGVSLCVDGDSDFGIPSNTMFVSSYDNTSFPYTSYLDPYFDPRRSTKPRTIAIVIGSNGSYRELNVEETSLFKKYTYNEQLTTTIITPIKCSGNWDSFTLYANYYNKYDDREPSEYTVSCYSSASVPALYFGNVGADYGRLVVRTYGEYYSMPKVEGKSSEGFSVQLYAAYMSPSGGNWTYTASATDNTTPFYSTWSLSGGHYPSSTLTMAKNNAVYITNYSFLLNKDNVSSISINNNNEYFALNYKDNKLSSIGIRGKKILECDQGVEVVGYRLGAKYIYYTLGSQKYELSIDKYAIDEYPQYEIGGLESYYLIFNTISYQNALKINSSTDIPFCSCDDYNGRSLFCPLDSGSDVDYLSVKLAQRKNNKWKDSTDATFKTVSELNASAIAIMPYTISGSNYVLSSDDIECFYYDSRYKVPDEGTRYYDVYLPNEIATATAQGALHIVGHLDTNGDFVEGLDVSDTWVEPVTSGDSLFVETTPSLMMSNYMMFAPTIYYMYGENSYQLLTTTNSSVPFFLYNDLSETGYTASPTEHAQFMINGSRYDYFANTDLIKDSSDTVVCSTRMFIYIGYSSKMAYFYCLFDKGIYVFKGDQSLEKIAALERYKVRITRQSYTEITSSTTSAMKVAKNYNIPCIDLTMIFFIDRALVMFGDQACFLECSTTSDVSANTSKGYMIIGNDTFCLSDELNDVEEAINIPIELETKFYGDESEEYNTINDCVYLEVSNLSNMNDESGTVTLQAIGLQNGKVINGKEKVITLKKSDFNAYNVALIKYQPDLQEVRGFKLKIKSEFDITDLRIGTTQGALNQSKYRV